MGEIQEKVWVVSRARLIKYTENGQEKLELGLAVPIKVFDDRSDAREFRKNKASRARNFKYFIDGVKKG